MWKISAMNQASLLIWLVVFPVSIVSGVLDAPGGPLHLPRMPVDTYKVFASFPNAVAISASTNAANLSCLAATQLEIDPEAKTTTYLWLFPSVGLQIPFKAKAGEKPGTMTFTVGEDSTPMEGIIYYTDEKSCAVADLEYDGHVCLLWARREVKDSVPQECIDHFEDVCGVTVNQHSRDLCVDGEGDY